MQSFTGKSLTISVDADGNWAWLGDEVGAEGIGACVNSRWNKRTAPGIGLRCGVQVDLADWAGVYAEKRVGTDAERVSFDARGLELARRVVGQVGNRFVVRYISPWGGAPEVVSAEGEAAEQVDRLYERDMLAFPILALGRNEFGWMQLAVLVDAWAQSFVGRASHAYDPFSRFAEWLNGCAEGRSEDVWAVYDERYYSYITYRCLEEDFIELLVERERSVRDVGASSYPRLLCRTTRPLLLTEFYRKWRHFLRYDYDPEHWELQRPYPVPDDVNPWIDLRDLDLGPVEAWLDARGLLHPEPKPRYWDQEWQD